jgi:hypothetical protein
MKEIRTEFEKKAGYIKSLYAREKSGKYKDDYLNAKWYGYLLWTGIKTNPNKI